MSTNMPNLKQIGGGHCKTLVDLTWNDPLSTECVHASSVNMFKNRIDKYLVKAGYT